MLSDACHLNTRLEVRKTSVSGRCEKLLDEINRRLGFLGIECPSLETVHGPVGCGLAPYADVAQLAWRDVVVVIGMVKCLAKAQMVQDAAKRPEIVRDTSRVIRAQHRQLDLA